MIFFVDILVLRWNQLMGDVLLHLKYRLLCDFVANFQLRGKEEWYLQ